MAQYALNCFLLFVPVLVLNALCYRKLPAFYQAAIWDDIPKPLDAAERNLRYLALLVPVLFRIRLDAPLGRIGLALYLFGIVLYFGSWFAQLRYGDSALAKTLPFRAAPAYTTIVWFAGIALIGESRLFPVMIVRIAYLAIVLAFVGAHTTHACVAHERQKTRGRVFD